MPARQSSPSACAWRQCVPLQCSPCTQGLIPQPTSLTHGSLGQVIILLNPHLHCRSAHSHSGPPAAASSDHVTAQSNPEVAHQSPLSASAWRQCVAQTPLSCCWRGTERSLPSQSPQSCAAWPAAEAEQQRSGQDPVNICTGSHLHLTQPAGTSAAHTVAATAAAEDPENTSVVYLRSARPSAVLG